MIATAENTITITPHRTATLSSQERLALYRASGVSAWRLVEHDYLQGVIAQDEAHDYLAALFPDIFK